MSKLDDVSIKAKTIAAFALLFVVAVAFGLVAVQGSSAIDDGARRLHDAWRVATRALGDFKYNTIIAHCRSRTSCR